MKTNCLNFLLLMCLGLATFRAQAQTGKAQPAVSVSVYEALKLAEKAVENKEYPKAMSLVRTELLKDPANPYLLYNYGLAAYLADDYKIARDAWGRLKSLEGENRQMGRDLASLSLFQLGNADIKEAVKFEQAYNTNDALLLYRRAISFYQISVSMEGDGSEKAKENLAVARKKFVELLSSAGEKKTTSLEKKFEQEKAETDPRRKLRSLEYIESAVREVQSDFEEALQINPEYQVAEQGLEKAKELLEKVALATAREKRDNLRKKMEADSFRSEEEKMAQTSDVLDKYDDVLDVNPENRVAEKEKGEIAREMAESMYQDAMKDKQKSEELQQQRNGETKALSKLEEAHDKLENALTLDETSPKIRKAEAETREALAEMKENRADDLVEKAESEENSDRKVKQLDAAVEEYEDVKEMKEGPDPELEQKLEDAKSSLAKAHEEAGDNLTKSSEWMDKFMELETGKKQDPSQKSEEELQTDIAKMERGIKEYEMATQLDPGLESAAASKEQAMEKLSELRDGLNQKRLAQEQNQPPQASDQEGDQRDPSDTTAQIDFQNENLRDLQVTRDIFRQRNYDTDRQEVKRDW